MEVEIKIQSIQIIGAIGLMKHKSLQICLFSKRYYAEYVEKARSNKEWVIVKTLRIKENLENYWLISKDFNIENVDCAKANCDSALQ